MIGEKEERCFNPWLGLLVIVLVCIVIAGAIFFGFRNPRPRQNRLKAAPKRGAVRANFGYPNTNVPQVPDDRLIF